MNQILQVKNTEKNSKKQNMKDIVLFFIIVLVIFGLVFGAYLVYKNIINRQPPVSGNSINVPEYIPTISLEQTERNKLKIRVESQIEVASLKYNWNNESPKTIELEGKSNIEKTIDIPMGENTIYISVIDIKGKETTKQESFVVEEPKPEIELSVVGSYIKITVTSEVELAEIIHNWNNENEKIEDMATYEEKNNFEKKIEIPIGQNTLKIVAVDVNGNKSEKSQEIKGITKAKTTTKTEGEYLHFTVTGNENIKAVEFEYNGKKYIMNTNTFGETKKVHYRLKLVEGMNYLKITSTTESGGVDTTEWEHQYTKE